MVGCHSAPPSPCNESIERGGPAVGATDPAAGNLVCRVHTDIALEAAKPLKSPSCGSVWRTMNSGVASPAKVRRERQVVLGASHSRLSVWRSRIELCSRCFGRPPLQHLEQMRT